MDERRKNILIQLVRGALCICVVFFHYTSRFSALSGYAISKGIKSVASVTVLIGMCGFCLISGYYAVNPDKDESIFRVMARRIKRLYPSYVISITVIFIMMSILPEYSLGREVPFSEYMLNILLLGFLPGRKWVDGAHWYLPFILIVCLSLAVIHRLKKLYDNDILWMLFFVCATAVIFVSKRYYETVTLYLLYYSMSFFGAYIRKGGIKKGLSGAAAVVQFIGTVFCSGLLSACILMAAMISIVFILLRNPTNGFTENAEHYRLTWLGDRSYNVYLVHQNIGYIIILLSIDKGISYDAACIMAFIITALLAAVIYIVDLKLQNLLNAKKS